MFTTFGEVSRTQWRDYVGKLNLQQNYPGIQGIGYSQVVTGSDLQRHIDTIRLEGFPDYTIRPLGERPVYTSIVYLEPFDARNQRAFGYDMFSEPIRRSAMEQARDTGNFAISGKVTLVQETTDNVQVGFLMYLPYYVPGAPDSTMEEREVALRGYIYAPFRMNDFMEGLLGKDIADIGVEIFDGSDMTDNTLMFRSKPLLSALGLGWKSSSTSVRKIDFVGYPWTLRFTSLPAFEAAIDHRVPRMTLAAGTCVSLLIFIIAVYVKSSYDRATSEKLTHHEKNFLWSIFHDLPVPYTLVDVNERVVQANKSCLLMLGLDGPIENYYGKTLGEFFYNDVNYEPFVRQSIRSGTIFRNIEVQTIGHNGNVLYVLANICPLYDLNGIYTGGMCIYIDQTERKLMEKALFEAGALQRAIFNSKNFSSIATDAKGIIQIFNVGAERMLGYSAAEVMDKLTPADISDPQEVVARAKELSAELDTPIAPGFEALVFKASRGIEDIYELTCIRKDGSRFPAVVSVTALRDDQDAIIGYLLIGTDNTEHKQVEDSKRRLEQLKEDVERITKHDLKTPLNGIINIPILLLDDDNLTPNQRKLIGLIGLSGHKMLQQINGTLELYKIETDAYIMSPIEFDPVKLVQDSIDMLTIGLQFDPSNIILQLSVNKSDVSSISIKTDRLLLDVIIMNLLRNAIESSDKGAQVVVAISQEGNNFIVAIANGRPVPAEIRDRFFEKYVTAGKSGGTGLGTYSAAMMTRAIGGTISMETSDETGTMVTVRIPIAA